MSQTVYSEEETETFRDMVSFLQIIKMYFYFLHFYTNFNKKFKAKEDFWKVWAEEMSGGIQHVVEFAKNMSCFMDLKHQKSGEHDQVTLLRSGKLHKKRSQKFEKTLYKNFEKHFPKFYLEIFKFDISKMPFAK